jgi:hypothetical protein
VAASELPTPPIPRPDPPRLREAVALGALMLLFAGGVLWWAAARDRAGRRAWIEPSAGGLASARRSIYAGDRACAACHPGESAHQSRSGHAHTLRVASRLNLARRLAGRRVANPQRAGVTWAYAIEDDQLFVMRTEASRVERFPIDVAFGSGHHALSFLTLTDPDSAHPTALEHHLTYYPPTDSLAITPGQRAEAPYPGTTPQGRVVKDFKLLQCFSCHTTATSDQGRDVLDATSMVPNVTCERCHGPGRAHIASARRGSEHLSMPFGDGNWTTETLLRLCGQCHRHPDTTARPDQIYADNPGLARFQPIGLMQSACFQRSQGALNCVTCHDPHARASANRSGYESACLTCHHAPNGHECTLSPRSGCLTCHMPRVDTGQRILFTDHWIRIRRADDAQPNPAATRATILHGE